VSNVLDFGKVSGVSLESISRELISYSRHKLPTERQLPENHEILQSLPVEILTQLGIPVVAFQEREVYNIERARCTGALDIRNQESRNEWVWVQGGSEQSYGALRGRLPAKLVPVALCNIMDYTSENAVRQVAAVRMLSAVNSGCPSDIHGLVTVPMREDVLGTEPPEG